MAEDEQRAEQLAKKREYMRTYVAANREKIRAANRESYHRNREAQLAKKKEWRDQHPGYFKQVNAEYYQRNLEQARAVRKTYRDTHKERQRELIAAWMTKNKDKVRIYRKAAQPKQSARNRLATTGCTPEQYSTLLEQQKGLCAICRRPPGKYALAADHCHRDQIVRGLLCVKCNSMLGMADDNMDILFAGIAYLQQYQPVAEGHDLREGAS